MEIEIKISIGDLTTPKGTLLPTLTKALSVKLGTATLLELREAVADVSTNQINIMLAKIFTDAQSELDEAIENEENDKEQPEEPEESTRASGDSAIVFTAPVGTTHENETIAHTHM